MVSVVWCASGLEAHLDWHIYTGPSETKECLIPTLRSIGGKLSHLTIHQLHVSLDDLLLACPKLTSLTLYVHYHIDFKCIALTAWPAITELSITPNRIRRTTVALICKSFPALQKLELHRCADMQCVLLITDSYPCLKYYSIMAYKIGVTLRASDRGIRQHAHGITHLDLCGPVQLDDNFKDTISLLKKHHATLEWLKLRMCLERDLHGVFSIAYPRLTKLNLDYSGWWTLRNAPVLEELVLSCGTIDEHPTVFNLIPATLKTLKMDITPHNKFQHIPDITRYFHRHSAQSNTTYLLKELIIYTHKMENVEMMLEGISHVKQLERLMIRYSDWDASEVDTFIDQLANGCHRLSCLKIYSSTTPSQHAVNALKRLGYLTHFAFNIEDKDSTEGRFWDAIETLTQTKCIEVYTRKIVQLLEMRRVKENRPDLEVIVNRRVLPFWIGLINKRTFMMINNSLCHLGGYRALGE